jgi:hypothetical protein
MLFSSMLAEDLVNGMELGMEFFIRAWKRVERLLAYLLLLQVVGRYENEGTRHILLRLRMGKVQLLWMGRVC